MVDGIFTTGQVAWICRVNARTVVKWIDAKELPGYRLPMGLDRRVTHAALEAFIAKHGMPADRLPKLAEAVV